MLYKSHRDFEPVYEYGGKLLGRFEHDDYEGFKKYDYHVYELAEIKDYDDGRTELTYDQIKALDISPYERSIDKIREVFEEFVDAYQRLEHGLEKSL